MKECIHHWQLPAQGRTVRGRCVKCGLEREFTNVHIPAKHAYRRLAGSGGIGHGLSKQQLAKFLEQEL